MFHPAECSTRLNVPPGRPLEYAQKELCNFYGLITSLDDAFGRLMSALERLGVADETIVIYPSDHGEMLGSHGYKGNKRWPYDESLQVPLLVRWPGVIPAGHVVQRPVGTPDLFPTLTDLAGLGVPERLDGVSAKDALQTGDESALSEFAYCTMPYAYVPWPGWRAVRSARYVYARTCEGPWLLFDHREDPLEMRNLVNDPSYRGLGEDLDCLLHERMNVVGDAWDYRLDKGDWKNWLASNVERRVRINDLGVPWPGGRPEQ